MGWAGRGKGEEPGEGREGAGHKGVGPSKGLHCWILTLVVAQWLRQPDNRAAPFTTSKTAAIKPRSPVAGNGTFPGGGQGMIVPFSQGVSSICLTAAGYSAGLLATAAPAAARHFRIGLLFI